MQQTEKSLAGRTLRWRFDDGPTSGTTFEHTFREDGTVAWRAVDGKKPAGPATKETGVPYASFEVAPGVHLVSYLAQSGYTLTVALNIDTRCCFGIASNEKEWYPLTGSLQPVE